MGMGRMRRRTSDMRNKIMATVFADEEMFEALLLNK